MNPAARSDSAPLFNTSCAKATMRTVCIQYINRVPPSCPLTPHRTVHFPLNLHVSRRSSRAPILSFSRSFTVVSEARRSLPSDRDHLASSVYQYQPAPPWFTSLLLFFSLSRPSPCRRAARPSSTSASRRPSQTRQRSGRRLVYVATVYRRSCSCGC